MKNFSFNNILFNLAIFFLSTLLFLIIFFSYRLDTSNKKVGITELNGNGYIAETFTTESDKIILVTGEYPPYVTSELEGKGFHYEIVEAVMDVLDIDYEIQFYPWPRCNQMVDNGLALAAFPYVEDNKRLEKYVFTDPIYINEEYTDGIFCNLDTYELDTYSFDNISDLSQLTFGGIHNYYYMSWFEKYNLDYDISYSELELFTKLINGRTDAVISDKYVALYTLKTYFPESENIIQISNQSFSDSIYSYHLMMNRNNAYSNTFNTQFSKGLAIIKENGHYDKILNDYKEYLDY